MSTPRPRSREWIERLIAFPTVSRDSNLALIGCVRDFLADHGIQALLVHDESGKKANLYATLGPSDRPGIMLSGHTDVVSVEGQDWQSDPFALVEREGRFYGRGVSDMKSFIAVVLAYVPRFLERKLPRRVAAHSRARRSRSALVMTATELALIAALAIIGLSSSPVQG